MFSLEVTIGAGIGALVCAQLMLQCLRSAQDVVHQRQLSRLRLEEIAEHVQRLRAQHARNALQEDHWSGWRKFTVQRKVVESADCCSLYLVPHDGRPLPPFQPGQFVTLSIKLPGQSRPLIRCYSLSDAPNPQYYRCTIKKTPPPADQPELSWGRASSYLVDVAREGDMLDVRAPSGAFCLDVDRRSPIVLIAGGIGITPMLSMLKTWIDQGVRRDAYLFYGVRDSRRHAFRQEIAQLAERSDQVHVHTCYSCPGEADRPGIDYQHASRVTPALLRQVLPSNNFDFFVCGPPQFMRTILEGLQQWGVPETHLFTEAFGPACVSPRRLAATSSSETQIRFERSGVSARWQEGLETLLQLAEVHDIPIDSGCRTGNCGTCSTAIRSGDVEYLEAPAVPPEPGTCLPCICAPRTNLVLDA